MMIKLVIFIAAHAQTVRSKSTTQDPPTLHRQGREQGHQGQDEHQRSNSKRMVGPEPEIKLQDEQTAPQNGTTEEQKNNNGEQQEPQKEALENLGNPKACQRPGDLSHIGIDVAKLKERVTPSEPQTYSTSEFHDINSAITDFEPSACLPGYDGTVKVSCSAKGEYTVDVNTCSTCSFGDKSKCNGAAGCMWGSAADGAVGGKCFVETSSKGTPCAETWDYKGETYSHCIGIDSYRPWCKRANGTFAYCACEKIPDSDTCEFQGCHWSQEKELPLSGCKTKQGKGEACASHVTCTSGWCAEDGLCGSEPDGLVKLWGDKFGTTYYVDWASHKPPSGGNCNSHKECDGKGTNYFCNIFREEACDNEWGVCPALPNMCEPMPEKVEGESETSSDDYEECPFSKCREGFQCVCGECVGNDGKSSDITDDVDTSVDNGECEKSEESCAGAKGVCQEGQFCDFISQRAPTCKEVAEDKSVPEEPARLAVGPGKCVLRITTGCAKHEGTHGTVADFTFTPGENKPDGEEYETWYDAIHSVGRVAGIKVYGSTECKAHFVFSKNRIFQNQVTMITGESPLSILCDADDPTELRQVSDLWTVDQELRQRPVKAHGRGPLTVCRVYKYDGCGKKKDEHMGPENEVWFEAPMDIYKDEFANVEALGDGKTMGVRIEAPLPGRKQFCEVKLINNDGTTETITANGDIHCIQDVSKIQCFQDPADGTEECEEEDEEQQWED